MPKFREKSSQSSNPSEKKIAKSDPAKLLKFKPFCDCTECTSKDCPDILQRLAIRLTENSCYFGPKGSGCADASTGSGKEMCPLCHKILPQWTLQHLCPSKSLKTSRQDITEKTESEKSRQTRPTTSAPEQKKLGKKE